MSRDDGAVLRLMVRPPRLHGPGAVLATIGLFIGAYAHDLWQEGLPFLYLFWPSVIALGIAAACFVQSYAVRTRSAVGLRLDQYGLSGYLLPGPILWSDIKDIDLVRGAERNAPYRVAIDLIYPDAHPFKRQTMLAPIDDSKPWSFDLTINHLPLRMTPTALRDLLREWHDKYSARLPGSSG